MLKYTLKRLLRSILTMLVLITVIYGLLQFMPEEGYFKNYEKMSRVRSIPRYVTWV